MGIQAVVAGVLLGAFYGVPKYVWERVSSSTGKEEVDRGSQGKGLSVEERLAREPTTGHYWGTQISDEDGKEAGASEDRGRKRGR